MHTRIQQLSAAARRAVQAKDWRAVSRLARELISLDSRQAEGHFLLGIAEKAGHRGDAALRSFERATRLDETRYDAAVEWANQLVQSGRYAEAFDLLQRYESKIPDSPLYLSLAATVYSRIGNWAEAWPLLERADALQPGVERILANMAECAVSLGRIERAEALYRGLLQRHPDHQQNHYQLSRLKTAKDTTHIEAMQSVLARSSLPPRGNIFLYYALGKEFEDLGRWDEAFEYYRKGGDAAAEAAAGNYSVQQDVDLIDCIIETCDRAWYQARDTERRYEQTPIFIVGLPRTGTTLVERILSSHSAVESAGETLAIEQLLRGRGSWVGDIRPEHIREAAARDMAELAENYLAATKYLLQGAPYFIEKYTYNFLYLGLIASAFPQAPLIHLRRNPMDACFAMYKQPYFRFAFRQDDLGPFYLAYRKLMDHWRSLLGERLIEVDYEALVADQETETRRLLDALGLEFEQSTLEFDRNAAPSATASAVQIREKVHSRSVGRWKEFESQLSPLAGYLREHGVELD